MRVPAWFNDRYAPAEVPSLARLAITRDALRRLDLIEPRQAEPIDPAMLQGLHDGAYLQAFLDGSEPLASRQGVAWTPAIRDASLAMLGGQMQAVEHVLEHGGVAMNIARGFHHAHPVAGSGFCALNGLALVAHAMPTLRVMVIDCDEHGGNGTEEFAAQLDNLFAVSIFGTRFGCRGGVRSWAFHVTHDEGFPVYRQALQRAEELLQWIKPDLLLYQAGADCHRHDPKSLLRLTTGEMFRRDLIVFDMARRHAVPTAFLIAGGYQAPERVARLNVNTVRAARWARRDPDLPMRCRSDRGRDRDSGATR